MGKRNMKVKAAPVVERDSSEEEISPDKDKIATDYEESTEHVDDSVDDSMVEETDLADREDLDAESFQEDDSESIPTSSQTQLEDTALTGEGTIRKSGVIYLSNIPPGMNVSKLREILSNYGAIGRIYLEPEQKGEAKKRRKATDTIKHGQKYAEGWVEFKKKRIAKAVAARLNNSQVGGKRRAPYYESLWNIKYLNRFKWNHLTERLVHEKMTRHHRLRQEIQQAKRQSNFFSQNVEKSKMLDRIQVKKSEEGSSFAPLKKFEMNQRLTDTEIRTKKTHVPSSSIKNVLTNLFPKR